MRFIRQCKAAMRWMSILVLVCAVSASGESLAAESDVSVGPLRSKYVELGEQLRNNPFRRPLYIESSQSSTHLKGEIFAVVDYPFATVNGALNNPAHWCDVLILHINVKYCNASRRADATVLTVNIGRKYFQPLEDAYRLDFNYRAVVTTPEYFAVELNADKGPLSTHDYRIWIEAAALENGRTFLHVTYAYEFGLVGRLAIQAYLATIGSDKVGFTVTGTSADGKPVYIRGVRGVVERNTMRYYLAIDAYFDALTTSSDDQLEQRLQKWYHSAEQYARQLHEVERQDYLDMKRREYQRQQVAR